MPIIIIEVEKDWAERRTEREHAMVKGIFIGAFLMFVFFWVMA